jgi:hypothetical protein
MPNQLFRKKAISAILADASQGLSDATHSASGLNKVLKVRDLTAMGIAAIVEYFQQLETLHSMVVRVLLFCLFLLLFVAAFRRYAMLNLLQGFP